MSSSLGQRVIVGIPLLIVAVVGAVVPVVLAIGVLRRGIDTGPVSWIVFGVFCLAVWILLFRSVVTARSSAAAKLRDAEGSSDR